MTPSAAASAAARRTGLGLLASGAWHRVVRIRPLAAVTAPVRVPLALVTAPLGRGGGPAGPLVVLRHGGGDVTPTELLARLQRSGPVSGRLAVLVPPAGADERLWERGRAATGATYAERLHDLLGWTPVHVRVAPSPPSPPSLPGEAGLELAALLQRLIEAWPVPVERVALVAAGSGGLVVRAACAVRLSGAPAWTELLGQVVGLGVPRYDAAPAPDLAVDVEHLLVTEQPVPGRRSVGAAWGRVVRWRPRRGTTRRSFTDLFPGARTVVLDADGPLTNRGDVHETLLRLLA